ncbi:MAG TPA: ABC transporter substrate-binding protein, partial [Rhizobium sp.]
MTNAFSLLRRSLIKGLAVTAIGVAALSTTAFAEDKPTVLRIGTTAPGHLKFILARHNHAFEKEFAKDGIKVDMVAFTNGGGEALTALATGAIEVTYTGNNPALRAAAKGADVKAIGLSSFTKNSSTDIIVLKDSPIKTVADLKGKK